MQKRQGVRAGNKLTCKNVEWEKNKMKVSIAAQTLPESVATVIEMAIDDFELEQFQGSEATCELI